MQYDYPHDHSIINCKFCSHEFKRKSIKNVFCSLRCKERWHDKFGKRMLTQKKWREENKEYFSKKYREFILRHPGYAMIKYREFLSKHPHYFRDVYRAQKKKTIC